MTLEPQLAAIRGATPAKPHNARTLAALTSNPGCARRAVLDAAGIDKDELATRLGHPAAYGMSRFALARGNAFEARVKDDRYADVFRILRDVLHLPIPEVAVEDLGEAAGNPSPRARLNRTRHVLGAVARGERDGALFDHPMLRLSVAGHPVFLEPDLIAFRLADRFHVIEIKSFPIVDGQADPAKVKSAATQAAAYVVALRALLADAGAPTDAVSDRAILIGPRNFTNVPVGARMDLRKEISDLERQLRRMEQIEDLLDLLPAGLCLELADDPERDPVHERAALVQNLDQIPARYRPDCLGGCGLGGYCRAQAREASSLDVLGPAVRESFGGVDTITMALALAEGTRRPDAEQAPVTAMLRHAARLDARLREAA